MSTHADHARSGMADAVAEVHGWPRDKHRPMCLCENHRPGQECCYCAVCVALRDRRKILAAIATEAPGQDVAGVTVIDDALRIDFVSGCALLVGADGDAELGGRAATRGRVEHVPASRALRAEERAGRTVDRLPVVHGRGGAAMRDYLYVHRTCGTCGRDFKTDCGDGFCSDLCEEHASAVDEARNAPYADPEPTVTRALVPVGRADFR